ncbi:MAG: helix-turn-helix transcriptional regulator, partial [Clostridia bacterium]|nr:helix-turn-helix transcriptional regulator [Clostridia bacterium]
ARQFGYSKSRFSHLFNETLGCPPGAFINALRCQHAARAMLESDQPLLEIAMNAGFECPRTFYRVFKQYYGVTPTQYCNAHRTAQPSSP